MQITNRIHFRNLRGDISGGLTAAVISLPLALALGVASGAGAVAGLYGAVLVGFFAALFGGTPTLMSEPTGPMTVVMTAIVATLTAKNPENGLAMAFTVIIVAIIGKVITGWSVFGQPGINRLAIGVGMIPRGEVGLVFAGIGSASGVLSKPLEAAIITMVILTTFIAPPF